MFPSRPQLALEALFVNRLQKPRPKRSVHGKGRLHDLPRRSIMLARRLRVLGVLLVWTAPDGIDVPE